MKHHPMYGSWRAMMRRCYRPADSSYRNYGGRGITVCERWHTFQNFLADVGERPEGMTLDRRDNNGNYEPGNVRWATRKEQQRNMRSNRLLEFRGQVKPLVVWIEELGLSLTLVVSRLKLGWSVERAFTAPPGQRKSRFIRGRRPQPWFGPIIHKHLDEINS